MLTALLGLAGALIYGSSDFLGGLASKRISALRVTAVAGAAGLALLLVALAFLGGTWSESAVFWGALSGISGSIAISLLYACLAIGPMSILSPLTAVVGAIVPMAWGLIGGDRFGPVGFVGLGLALVAVILVGFVPEKGAVRPTLRGVAMAVGSGTMIGAFIIFIAQTPHDSGLVPLVLNRAVNATIMFTIVGAVWLVSRRRGRIASAATASSSAGWRPGLALAIICGLVDAFANTLLLVGLRLGDLTTMSVLTAMYPAGTILLAAIVLKERIAPVQWVGLGLALSAAALLAIA